MENKPVRVLHAIQRMETGGSQALLMNLYRNIDRSKIQFDFIVEYDNKNFYDDEILKLGGKIYYTNVRNDFNIFKFCRQLSRILKKHPEYKIIHAHTYSIGYFVLRTAKKCGVPIRIVHSHNAQTVHNIFLIPKLILQKLYTIHATDLLACSDKAGKYLYGNKKYSVLKNSIPTEKFKFDLESRNITRKKLGIEDCFVVGHTGRFHEQKNHMFLLSIFREIKKLRNNSKLLLIGSGDLEDTIIKKAQEMGIYEDLIILKNRNDMNNLYHAMDVFVFPSLFEGLSVAALEVQASGLPILCSDALSLEHNVTPLFYQLSLNDSPIEWAKKAIDISSSKYSHNDMTDYIINAGLDATECAKKMESFYLEKYNTII